MLRTLMTLMMLRTLMTLRMLRMLRTLRMLRALRTQRMLRRIRTQRTLRTPRTPKMLKMLRTAFCPLQLLENILFSFSFSQVRLTAHIATLVLLLNAHLLYISLCTFSGIVMVRCTADKASAAHKLSGLHSGFPAFTSFWLRSFESHLSFP